MFVTLIKNYLFLVTFSSSFFALVVPVDQHSSSGQGNFGLELWEKNWRPINYFSALFFPGGL
jgi:hypothetical protein